MLRRSLFRLAAAGKSIEDQYASTGSGMKGGPSRDKTSLQISIIKNKAGTLLETLRPFMEQGINIHNVSNRRTAYEAKGKHLTMFIDCDAHIDNPKMKLVLDEIAKTSVATQVIGSWHIPWYPTSIADLDLLDQSTLAAGADLQDDPENPHPGFHDEVYKQRRREICQISKDYKYGQKIPTIDYTKIEVETWGAMFDKLTALHPTHACRQFNYVFSLLRENAGFARNNVPQLQEVSEFLQDTTGFSIRPVTGLLSSRDFFNGLAFRTFFSTQYLRHYSKPFYTPEPDLCHELMGHVPLFADKEFADFSQTLGLASLGASDAVIEQLSRCYWYTVEFGLCKQVGGVRAFGAGILSSFGELEYSLSGKPELRAWDPFEAAKLSFPITKFQPMYFVAEDFNDAQVKLERWIATLDCPFELEYNSFSKKINTYPKAAEAMLLGSSRV